MSKEFQDEIWAIHNKVCANCEPPIVPGSMEDLNFLCLGIAGEGGEVADAMKKLIRDGSGEGRLDDILLEVGDTYV